MESIITLKIRRGGLQRAIKMMQDNWGTFTNEAGFKMAEHPFMKQLLEKDYICPFEFPYNGGAKPFLMEMYILMTEEMLKEIERQIKAIEDNEPSC